MAKSRVTAVTDTVRSGIDDVSERAGDMAEVIAGRFGDALETAATEGRRLRKQLGKDLGKRWTLIDKTSRENPYYLALGALAVGVAIGYLITRDRSSSSSASEESEASREETSEIGL